MIQVLFVCLGNICRSPMAEALFAHKVKLAGLEDQITADSAGTGDWHVGELPHMGTRQILAKNGVGYEHRARQIIPSDLDDFDYVIVMDEANKKAVQSIGLGKAIVASLLSYATHLKKLEVPDPYYTGNFQEVYALVDAATEGLLKSIREEHAV
jgi:protein-tyrosine phosphatase